MKQKKDKHFRFELLDKGGDLLRNEPVIEGGVISCQEPIQIRRGGTIEIDEILFTLTEDYLEASGDSSEVDFKLDKIKVYGRALSPDEIKRLYDGEKVL